MRPRKTILCVDDNEQVLSVRKFLLETRGYRVLAVASAKEALERLNEVVLDFGRSLPHRREPVADTAQVASSAKVPAPISGLSPTRPGSLPLMRWEISA